MSSIFSHQIYFSKTRCGARNKNLATAKKTEGYSKLRFSVGHQWEVFTQVRYISDFFKFTFSHNDSCEVVDEVHPSKYFINVNFIIRYLLARLCAIHIFLDFRLLRYFYELFKLHMGTTLHYLIPTYSICTIHQATHPSCSFSLIIRF